MQLPPRNSTGSLTCPHCAKTFGKLEHLKRHSLIHTREKSFPCRTCAKEFTRTDALKRHEATHQNQPSLLQFRARACINCATAKEKCSGEPQCSRCCRRNLRCNYPAGHRLNSTVIDSPVMLDSNFWNPNILSTSNWLDSVDTEFPVDFLDPAYRITLEPEPIPSNLVAASCGSNACDVANPAPLSDRSAASGGVQSTGELTEGAAQPVEDAVFYVDGEPARRPRTKRRRTSTLSRAHPWQPPQTLSLISAPLTENDRRNCIPISAHAYSQLQELYQTLCLRPGVCWQAFDDCEFPQKDLLDHLIYLYFQHFDQALPYIHRLSLVEPMGNVLLILPLTAIGSCYLGWSDVITFSTSMIEFSKRFVSLVEQRSPPEYYDEYTLHQARLLNAIGMVYSGSDRLKDEALLRRHIFVEVFAAAKIRYHQPEVSYQDIDEEWRSWIGKESAARLAYAAWLIDCMWSYQFSTLPTLSLQDGSLLLPCPETQWATFRAQEWKEMETTTSSSPSLTEAVQQLYIDKKLPRDRGQFARILTIHGLFQHSWDIERYMSNPLTTWEPTARRESSAAILPKPPIWLPSISSFAKWQSSACDALDVLHWQANATIGQASGLEHPEVLHLHFARIVLLVPYKEILACVEQVCSGSSTGPNADVEIVQRWAIQNQYKARLAVIHSGVTFWHIRQYSIDAFYEAHAVALATLTLWAYGRFAPRPTSLSRQHTQRTSPGEQVTNSAESSSDEGSSIILLDHPTDDELVQQFIRNGQRMRTHMTGVGDLLGSKGPARVVLQGCHILSSLKCWGIYHSLFDLLQRLAQTYAKT